MGRRKRTDGSGGSLRLRPTQPTANANRRPHPHIRSRDNGQNHAAEVRPAHGYFPSRAQRFISAMFCSVTLLSFFLFAPRSPT
jgi:hypothetical protein